MATVTGSKRLLDLEVTSVEANTVVASGTVTASGGNSSNWNTAYGWGNHASAGYLTSVPNLDASKITTGTFATARIPTNISITGNAATATKWATARTLSLTGAVTGSASIDGSGNVSLATTATADPTLTLAGDASGSATFTNLGNATLTVTVADDSHNHVISNVDGLQAALDGKEASFTKNTAFNKNFGTAAGTVAQGNDSRINNGQTAYGWGDHGSAGYLTGNQTITLTGDVSGSGTTSISVTVADDSHNHVISNVDGLQTALDAKAPTASPTFTGTANIPAVNFSGASSLAVGSYVFAYEVGAAVSVRDIGDTVAGSNLMPTMVSINNPSASAANVNGDVVVFPGTDDSSTLSGTWMLMGGYADNYLLNDYPSTLWLRIS